MISAQLMLGADPLPMLLKIKFELITRRRREGKKGDLKSREILDNVFKIEGF